QAVARRESVVVKLQSVPSMLTYEFRAKAQRIYSAPLRLCGRNSLFLGLFGLRLRSLFLSFLRFFAAAFFPLRRRSFGALLRGLDGFNHTRIVDQFDNRQLGSISISSAELQNACVTTRSILVTLSEFAKQTAQCRDSGGALRPELTTLTSRFFDGSVAGVKVTGCLPAQMQRTRVSAVVGQCACST